MKHVLIYTLLFLSFYTSADPNNWQLEKDDKENNIQVFTRLDTKTNSDLKEFKGVTIVKSTLSGFIALLNSEDLACTWMYNCLEYKVIDKPSPIETYSYVVNDAPWPVASRDMVIHSSTSQSLEDLTVQVKLIAAATKMPIDDDYVRVSILEGKWQFKPLPNDEVEVTYQVLLDPAGNIPTSLTNAMIVDTPYNTLQALQEIILMPKLQKATFDFIIEPANSVNK